MNIFITICFYTSLFFAIFLLPYAFDIDFISFQFAVNLLEYCLISIVIAVALTNWQTLYILPAWGWILFLPISFIIMLVINGSEVPINMRYLLIKYLFGCVLIAPVAAFTSHLDWILYGCAIWLIIVLLPFGYHYIKYRKSDDLFVITRTGLFPIYLISMLPPSLKNSPVFIRIKGQQRCLHKLDVVKKELEKVEKQLRKNRLYIIDTHSSILNRVKSNGKYRVLYSNELLSRRYKRSKLLKEYKKTICHKDASECKHQICVAGINDIFEEMIFIVK